MGNDEIQLIDILRIFYRRKALILSVTVVCTLVALGVSLTLPEIYRVTTIIEPGKIPISNAKGQVIDEKIVESPEFLRETILGGAYDRAIRAKLNILPSGYPKLKVDIPKGTTLLTISVESADPAQAVAILEELNSQVTPVIQEKVDREVREIWNLIKLAELEHQKDLDKIKLVKDQLTATDATIHSLEADRKIAMIERQSDAMAVLLYSNEIQNHQRYYNQLQSNLKDFEMNPKISNLKIENMRQQLAGLKASKMHKAPTAPEYPIKPKKSLIVVLGFMLGLMGSTLLAFLLEYLRKQQPLK